MLLGKKKLIYFFITLIIILCGVFFYIYLVKNNTIKYSNLLTGNSSKVSVEELKEKELLNLNNLENAVIKNTQHIKTPEAVKAVYISSWVAGSKNLRNKIIEMIDNTELNAVVIDIKDSTGKISFKINNPEIVNLGSSENRIIDIESLTSLLHEKNIYVIGRISVFQDPYYIKKYPELAVKTKTDHNQAWKDRKGLSWIDPGSQQAWDYTVLIAKESYNLGFDELNFDYIRFPSDGDMSNMYFPISNGKVKAEVIKSFFIYLNSKLKEKEIPMSADLFGMTTTQFDDMNIGQIWENALPYFDFLCPMVYPSHYPKTWNGFSNPAEKPYEVITLALKKAVERTELAGFNKNKIRPWLQDFDLGATYTKEMVKAQIQATYDLGINSWSLWDPSNKYTPTALVSVEINP